MSVIFPRKLPFVMLCISSPIIFIWFKNAGAPFLLLVSYCFLSFFLSYFFLLRDFKFPKSRGVVAFLLSLSSWGFWVPKIPKLCFILFCLFWSLRILEIWNLGFFILWSWLKDLRIRNPRIPKFVDRFCPSVLGSWSSKILGSLSLFCVAPQDLGTLESRGGLHLSFLEP